MEKNNMKCPTCNKPIKENTESNIKYCQGHYLIDKINEENNNDKI